MKLLVFPFRNEFEILETKLATLGDHVDRIIIAEGAYTFSGQKREPTFMDWADSNPIYAKYANKILYHIDMDMINAEPVDRFQNGTEKRWGLDVHLRNSLGDIALMYNPDDTVILTDCDEIPNTTWVDSLDGLDVVEHALLWRHAYYVDYRAPHCRLHEQVCRAFPVKRLKTSSMENIARQDPQTVVGSHDKGWGWHFTYMQGAEAIQQKLHDFAHGEYDKPPWNTLDHIEGKIFTGADLFNRQYNNCIKVNDIELPHYMQVKKRDWIHMWSPGTKKK